MSLDAPFRPALDKLAERLRRDTERHLDAAIEELTARAEKLAVSTEAERTAALEQVRRLAWEEAERATTERLMAERSEADRAFEARLAAERADVERATTERLSAERAIAEQTLLDRFAREKTEAERNAEDRMAAEVEAAEARVALRLRAADVAAGERLVASLRAIDESQSLSDVLDALANAALVEAPRVAIFMTTETQCTSWRAQGFEPDFSTAEPLQLSSDVAGIVTEAMQGRRTLSAGGASEWPAPGFAHLPVDRLAVAVPLVVNDEVVVVLYADEGRSGDVERASWPTAIEILARHASRALEAITAQRLVQTLSERSHIRPRVLKRPLEGPGSSFDADTGRRDQNSRA
jgi:hypothetical protein